MNNLIQGKKSLKTTNNTLNKSTTQNTVWKRRVKPTRVVAVMLWAGTW